MGWKDLLRKKEKAIPIIGEEKERPIVTLFEKGDRIAMAICEEDGQKIDIYKVRAVVQEAEKLLSSKIQAIEVGSVFSQMLHQAAAAQAQRQETTEKTGSEQQPKEAPP